MKALKAKRLTEQRQAAKAEITAAAEAQKKAEELRVIQKIKKAVAAEKERLSFAKLQALQTEATRKREVREAIRRKVRAEEEKKLAKTRAREALMMREQNEAAQLWQLEREKLQLMK